MGPLVALSALSARWSGSGPREIGEDLAEVLCGALRVSFVYVRIDGPGGQVVLDVARTPEGPISARLVAHGGAGETPTIPNPLGSGTLRVAATPLGYEGECGVVVAASSQRDFPSETDRLLLVVAANQAGIVLQRWRAREELADFLDNATVAFHSVAADGTIVRANRAELDLLGYRPHEYVGRPIAEFHADADVAADLLRRMRAGEALRDYEARLRCKDGSIKHVLISSTVQGEDFTRDITDRKRAEEALRRQTELFTTLVERIPDIVSRFDRDLRYIYISPAVRAITGRDWQEYIGKPRTDQGVSPEFAEVRRQLSRKVFETGQEQILEFPIRAARGDRVLECRFIPEFAADGSVESLMTLTRDVTERKRAEEALRESEHRFRVFADTAPAMLWVTEPDGSVSFLSRGWCEFTGQTEATALGFGWLDAVHPDDRAAAGEKFLAANAAREPFAFEYRLRRSDGEYRWAIDAGRPRFGPGREFLGYIGSVIDITERKQAEDRGRLLWEAAALLLGASNPEAMIRALFATIGPRLGFDTYFYYMVDDAGDALRLESCVGVSAETARSIRRLEFGEAIAGTVALRRQPIVATRIQQSDDPNVQLVKSLGIRTYACHPLMSGGRLFGTLSFASRSRDTLDDDEVAFLETICHYVTVAYERLRLLGQLKEADRRKDEFLATLAHELRNPLAPVRTAVEVLRLKGSEEPELRWSRDVIDRQVTHLTRLIDDLLDVSRITRDRLELRKERVELAEVVRGAVETSRPLIEECGHELTVTLPPEPVFVHGDLVRLAQIFMNLLTNAAKYTDRGGRIWLTAERDGADVVVAVRDTGVGIPAEKLPRLFAMFFQVDRSLERSHGGLGIGLSLVRRLVELHGGSVTARSAGSGKGSEFTVRLPALADERSARPAPESSRGSNAPARAGRRILVVDDTRDSADALAILLQLGGNEVETAYDGLAAVEAAERWRPDVVLLDIGMPKLNGYDACRHIREQPWGKSVVLIALTGWGQEEDRRRTREAGFDGHLVKPVDPSTLMKLLAASPPNEPTPAG